MQTEISPTQCIIHDLPIVVDDKIRNQKLCRLCLLEFIEGDEIKSKHRAALMHSLTLLLDQASNLSFTALATQSTAEEKLKETIKHSDEAFEAIIAGVSAEREACRNRLIREKSEVQKRLKNSAEIVEEVKKSVEKLKEIIVKPGTETVVDLSTIEHQTITIKKVLAAEEKKLALLQHDVKESGLFIDYSEEKLANFLGSSIRLVISDASLSKSLDQSLVMGNSIFEPMDSVSENFEPIVFKFVWNTRQADCYQILKGAFCTLSIPVVSSKDPEVTNASFSIPKFSKSVITEYNRAFLIGGAKLDAMSSLKYTFEFELETLKLTKKANMRLGRYHHAVVYTNGLIYVSGGVNKPVTINNVERYDIAHDVWSEVAKMTYPRSCHSLCVFGEILIFAIFGQIANDIANTIERYEINNDAWTVLNVAVPRWVRGTKHMGSHMLSKDEVIVFGGADGSSSQFCADSFAFNPLLGEFRRLEKMRSVTIFRNQPAFYKGRLYAFGVDNYVHVFDIHTKRWSYIYDKLS